MQAEYTDLMLHSDNYFQQRAEWHRDPATYWHLATENLDWDAKPSADVSVTDDLKVQWFGDGKLNGCFNAVDRHVHAGRGDFPAIKWRGATAAQDRTLTYDDVLAEVSRLAGVLKTHGVGAGDRVMIYMPQIPETVVAMLAAARLGAMHVVVFGGFSGAEIARRIAHCQPTVFLTASFAETQKGPLDYMPMVNEALAIVGEDAPRCIVFQRDPDQPDPQAAQHLDWATEMAAAEPASCVSMPATDPLYILYTSGTSGSPKGVVHDIGGSLVGMFWSGRNIYGMKPGQTFWAASDLGWAAAHTCSVWAPLVNGAATVIFEGKPIGTPDATAYWRLIQDLEVDAIFCAPTPIRAMMPQTTPAEIRQRVNLDRLSRIYLAGEMLDASTYAWLRELTPKAQLINHWWQTETAWPIAASLIESRPNQPYSASVGVAMPGYDLWPLDEAGQPCKETGVLSSRLPLPPGFMTGLWQDNLNRYRDYFSDDGEWYLTFDAGFLDAAGKCTIVGRTDDVLNVSGHRLAAGDIEAAILESGLVDECVVVGRDDTLKGQVPVAFVVMGSITSAKQATLSKVIMTAVRRRIGPVATLAAVIFVAALPVTRSGKILRRTMRELLNGLDPKIPETIENPNVIESVRKSIIQGKV